MTLFSVSVLRYANKVLAAVMFNLSTFSTFLLNLLKHVVLFSLLLGSFTIWSRQPAAASRESEERRVSYAPLYTSWLPEFTERNDRSQVWQEAHSEYGGNWLPESTRLPRFVQSFGVWIYLHNCCHNCWIRRSTRKIRLYWNTLTPLPLRTLQSSVLGGTPRTCFRAIIMNNVHIHWGVNVLNWTTYWKNRVSRYLSQAQPMPLTGPNFTKCKSFQLLFPQWRNYCFYTD